MGKSFKDNPAMAFISQESINQAEAPTTDNGSDQLPASRPYTVPGIESKSKRIQLLIQPTLHKALKEKASEEGLSFNEAVTRAIREYLKGDK